MTPRPLVDVAWDWLAARPAWLLALIALALYAATASYDFALDDLAVYTGNRFVQKGVAGIPEVLAGAYWEGFSDNAPAYYRPLSLLSFCLEVSLTGGHPGVAHALNALLYASLAPLAWALLRRAGPPPVAFAGTLLWLVHPTHVEVVANIKGRDELLGAALGLAMLLLGARGKLLLSGLAMFGAMLAKESSLTLLAVLPALLWWTGDASPRRVALSTLGPLAGALGWWVCRFAALGSWTIEHPENMEHVTQNALLGASSTSEYVGTLLGIVARYAGLLVAPWRLGFDYSVGQVPVLDATAPLALLGGALTLAWLLGLALSLRRGSRAGLPLFGMLATFSVASNAVVLVVGSTMGERYLFLPSLFFCLLVAQALAPLSRGALLERGNWRWLLPVLVLGGLGALRSGLRLPDWRDNGTLIEADMAQNPGNPRIVSHYAIVRTTGLKPVAPGLEALEAPLDLHALDPQRYHWAGVHAYTARGDLLRGAGRLDEAMKAYQRAVELEPAHFLAWFNIGWIHYEQGRPREAAEAYGTGLRYKADHPLGDADPTPWAAWWLNTCIAARESGQLDMALQTCQQAVEARPSWGQAWAGLGLVEQARGDEVRAQELFQRALALDPGLSP